MIRRVLDAAARVAFVLIGLRLLFGGGSTAGLEATGPEHQESPLVARAKRWGFIAAALLVLAGIGGAALVVSGIVPIKASSGHWAITAWFLDFAKRRSVATHSILTEAPSLDEERLVLKGAGHFQFACRPCHGSPGLEQPVVARHMTPRPPDLQTSVKELDPTELFYIVKHGIKLTGMPAWPAQQRDDEVWAMVAFLRTLPELNEESYERLVIGRSSHTDSGDPMSDLIVPESVPRAITESCSRCHGADGLGRGTGAFPKLAGQRPAYLNATLQAYARGERHSGIMQPVAAAVDPDELQAIASYYAALGDRAAATAAQTPSSTTIDRGRAIATSGIPNRLVPPCLKCHGASPRRNPHYPSLAGQYADYIVLQLTLFKEERRGGTAYYDIMRRVAGGLSEEDIQAVAQYFASLPAEPTRPGQ